MKVCEQTFRIIYSTTSVDWQIMANVQRHCIGISLYLLRTHDNHWHQRYNF